ncbi:MAG: hypothetical protein LCH61_10075 [Proteobacteria bacterium]|nr:hypothetical protein [Pseudomonadota bacterium]
MPQLDGIKDLIPFLNFLDKRKIFYWLSHDRPESIMVEITRVGKRIEVDFFDDHIEYSVFEGNEDVLDDQEKLSGMIRNFGVDEAGKLED